MSVFRVKARRMGSGDVLGITLPAAMSHAIPEGHHWFDASFTDDGIRLVYVGPAEAHERSRVAAETPAWATKGEAS